MAKHNFLTSATPTLLLFVLISIASTFINPSVAEGQYGDCTYTWHMFGFCIEGGPVMNGAPPVTLTFTGSPSSITSGQSATLSWTSANAIQCTSSDFVVPAAVFDGVTYDGFGATSGSVSVSPSATKSYTLSCTGLGDYSGGTFQGSTQTKSVTITVTGAPTTPTTPTNDPTSNGFSNIFQIDDDADHSAIYATVPISTVDLTPSGTAPMSTVYAFPSAGKWYVRACADMPPYPNGAVSESDETNNCGAWVSKLIKIDQCVDGIDNDGDGLTDSADGGCADGDGDESTGAITASLSAAPSTIRSGQSSTLTWSSSNAASCTGSGFATGGARSGSVSTGALTSTQNYGVTCGTAADYRTVTVTIPTVYIAAEPTLVDARPAAGGSMNLKWSAAEVSACTISSSTSGPSFTASYVAPTGTTTTAVTGIKKQTRFTLTCTPLVGTDVSSSVLVNVIANFDEF